jgi:hypothetical protein
MVASITRILATPDSQFGDKKKYKALCNRLHIICKHYVGVCKAGHQEKTAGTLQRGRVENAWNRNRDYVLLGFDAV